MPEAICAACGAKGPHGRIRCLKCGKPLMFAAPEMAVSDYSPRYYILVGHKPVKCDLMTWGRWFETADRHVADTFRDDVRVSTVFLGLDHSHTFEGPPVLFETMVFINGSGDEMERYCTWDEAVEGHERMVAKIFKPTPILALPTEGEK